MVDQIPDPPDVGPEQLTAEHLSRSKRGYDPVEVTSLLGRAADALRTWQERDRRLWERVTSLSADLDDALEVDEAKITAALGEETARIISVAREAGVSIREEASRTAAQVVEEADAAAEESRRTAQEELESARSEAERLRTEVTLEAADLRREAEEFSEVTRTAAEARRSELLSAAESILAERTTEAEAAASAIRGTAEVERDAALSESERIRSEAQTAAAEVVQSAIEEGRAMVAEAQEYREQLLRSLAARHQEANRRIDAARAERDRIVAAIRDVGSTLDVTVDDLSNSDDVFEPQPHVSVEEFITRAATELRPVPQIGGSPVDPGVADPTATPVSETDEIAPETEAETDDPSSSAVAELPVDGDITREEAVLDRRIIGLVDEVAPIVALPTAEAAPDGPSDDATVHDLFERVRAATEDTTAETGADPEDAADPEDVAPDDAPDSVLDRRDLLLDPIGEALARSLKRAVSDEQNEVLDQLRRARRQVPSLEALLGDVDDVSRYLGHLLGDLRSAARAGAEFWSIESAEDPHGDPAAAVEVAVDEGGSLYRQVEELLGHRRAHLARVLDEAAESGLDLSGVQSKVRGAYREWRSGQSEGAAGDLAAAGFAIGMEAAARPDARWCWVVDNGGLPCADAEDNALAGPVSVGNPFPTGDRLPPAHSGCRCILIPSPR